MFSVDNLNLLLTKRPVPVYLVPAVVWLGLVGSLMIADVWDETNAQLVLTSEPVLSASLFEAVRMIWLQELGLNMYRPVANTLFMTFGKLSGGSFVVLRLVNAALLLGAISLFTAALKNLGVEPLRRFGFFLIMLYSGSVLICASWFANIFDVSCLFFIALATWAYTRDRLALCCAGIALAVFSKEVYLLIVPLFLLLIIRNEREDWRRVLIMTAVFTAFSLLYWLLRQAAVPLGSEQDLRSFGTDNLVDSVVSMLAGLVFQFSKFTRYNPVYWAGLLVLLLAFIGLRDFRAKLAVMGLLILCVAVYWSMFGHQGDEIVTYHNFAGRLFLVPFAILLFILVWDARWPVLVLVGLSSMWGYIATWRDHRIFQQTYAEIYELAERTEGSLVIHYPEKPLNDFNREILIGDFPDAEFEISSAQGGLAARE